MTYLDQNRIFGTYWTGGPYGDINSVGPFCDAQGKFVDAVQMPILQRHLTIVGAQNGVVDVTPTVTGDNNGTDGTTS